jgi:hypothetical protein
MRGAWGIFALGVLMAGTAVGAEQQDSTNILAPPRGLQNRKGIIGDYGIFEPVGAERVKLEAAPSGEKLTPTSVKYLDRTRWIPARKGIRFGFDYEILNATEGPVEVTVLVKHPEMRKPDGTLSKGFKFKERVPLVDGKARGFTGYSFDHDYELVPGEWKFELWVREGKLAEWTFIACQDNGTWQPLPYYERDERVQ